MEFHRVLVPIGGTEADEEAIKLACGLTRKKKGIIWAIYVITIKRTLPLEAEIESEIREAETILDRIMSIAEEQDHEIDTDILQAREAGPAIIDEATEREVDLILMGIKHKTRFGQFSLGNAAPYILKNAPCPVMLYQK